MKAEHDAQVALSPHHPSPTRGDRLRRWFSEEGAWWAASFVFHCFLMALMMVVGTKYASQIVEDTITIGPTDVTPPAPPENVEIYKVEAAPVEPTHLADSVDPLVNDKAVEPLRDSAPPGGGAGVGDRASSLPGDFVVGVFDVSGGSHGKPGFGTKGASADGGHSAPGASPFAYREKRTTPGSTKTGDKAVMAALNWIARHQMPNGNWSLGEFNRRCKGGDLGTCSGVGSAKSDVAATALALLPFLAAGQSHNKGLYRQNIFSGLYWLISNQKPDGNLAAGSAHAMYSHGLAAICLCEAYGLSNDRQVGKHAQLAIDFIQKTQNKQHGGWRYQATSSDGDTSVVGWQVMALKSAQMAYLKVDQQSFDLAKKWLASVASGNYRGLYGYTPEAKVGSPSMTAVGLLLQQYMGMKPGDLAMREGVEFLMKRLPDNRSRQLYYWYYATQVMHNIPGQDWDTWNRKMRRVLVESQIKEGCMAGSWDPARPTSEQMGEAGGRLAVTSLSALTLEVYYRYLPLYQLDNSAALSAGSKPAPMP